MKTQINISNLKKLGLSLIATIALSGSIFANKSEAEVASVNLNLYMKAQEQSILYKAPAMTDEYEAGIALENLAAFTKQEEASILYKAPVEDDATAALEDLQSYATSEMAAIRYEAPAVDLEVEVAPELESLQMFADKMSYDIKYRAPESADFAADEVTENADNMIAETR